MLCDFIGVMEVHHMNFRGGLNTHENEGFPGGVMFSWRHSTHENETASVKAMINWGLTAEAVAMPASVKPASVKDSVVVWQCIYFGGGYELSWKYFRGG